MRYDERGRERERERVPVILKSARRRTSTDLSRTIAGHKDNAETTAHAGTNSFFHWDGSYETYHAFFAHLRCKLDNINISGLEFGV